MNAALKHPLPSQQPLRLGLLTHHNPYDRRAFSGTVYFAARALERNPNIQLSILGPHRAPHPLDGLLRRSSPKVDANAVSFDGLDAVVGLVATRLLDPILDRDLDIPVVHVTDATPAFLRDAYGWNVPKDADAAEARVARRANATIYSSQDMARRAPADLGIPKLRANAICFGVNLDKRPDTLPRKPALNKLNLLFVGLDWDRKGGETAVAALDRLRANGVDAHLTVVGRCPEKHRKHQAITYAGFLNKNRPRDAARLGALYAKAHLLLLPSRADCTPMVLGEAMAFGTPALASDTGGIGALIGGTGAGCVMAQTASPQDWADQIRACTKDKDAYALMSDAAFDRADNVLSWDAWASELNVFLHHIIAAPTQPLRVVA